jgi:hypothetical protein
MPGLEGGRRGPAPVGETAAIRRDEGERAGPGGELENRGLAVTETRSGGGELENRGLAVTETRSGGGELEKRGRSCAVGRAAEEYAPGEP